ncbi:hypothetical protein AB4354_22115 [Vibrio splendidus]|uniref:hypothetical protein n=1 Tax=Vibrio splendidus TaxID=29497 RepID=UPI00105475AA|nr:hypothetical protein [Vibrio splendidus]
MNWLFVLLNYFAFTVFISVFITMIFSSIICWKNKELSSLPLILVLLIGVSVIGACAGFSGGMSRVGVVGAIIPAMFTLLGGFSIYLFGVDTTKGVLSSITSACFALSLFVAYATGSQLRNIGDETRDLRRYCANAYSDPKLLANKESLTVFEEKMGDWCNAGMVWNLGQANEINEK